jgi:hypothetical protein
VCPLDQDYQLVPIKASVVHGSMQPVNLLLHTVYSLSTIVEG